MKYFERIQRGESANLSVPSSGRFDRNSPCQSLKHWELVMSNRESKRQLSELVGKYFLCKAREVPHGKILLISGCFEGDYKNQCLRVSSSEEQPEILTEYECHHEETDTRFYFLLSRNNAKSSLLASPDSDILHIGTANQLKLSNSVDIFSGFIYGSVNLLLKEIERDEQLPVLQIISRG